MQYWKMRHHLTDVENAGLENATPLYTGVENEGLENARTEIVWKAKMS